MSSAYSFYLKRITQLHFVFINCRALLLFSWEFQYLTIYTLKNINLLCVDYTEIIYRYYNSIRMKGTTVQFVNVNLSFTAHFMVLFEIRLLIKLLIIYSLLSSCRRFDLQNLIYKTKIYTCNNCNIVGNTRKSM